LFQIDLALSVNYRISITTALNKTEHKIYNTLVVMQHLLNIIDIGSSLTGDLKLLFSRYGVENKRMGFPDEWHDLPIWKVELKI